MVSNRANAICLLKLLQEYSDEAHILSMREIKEKLKSIYDITIDRRTVYSTVELLQLLDYDISTYEENGVGYYLRTRNFEPSEIRLLTDAVYAFDYITPKQTKDLAQKLQKLLSVHARKPFRHLHVIRPERKTKNPQVFLNIELLEEAIDSEKKGGLHLSGLRARQNPAAAAQGTICGKSLRDGLRKRAVLSGADFGRPDCTEPVPH